jgi:hypothetical protein
MACEYSSLLDYLRHFNGQDPINSVVCPYTSDAGAGMGMPLFALFVIGVIFLALSIRAQHPGPILVAGILSIGLFATALPGQAAQIAALVLFFGLAGIIMYIYQRAQSAL